ncbi:MAG: OmpA family protein [Nitrospirae bacterium]|nr:OmpA family protein [Nitrospirota bacterium]
MRKKGGHGEGGGGGHDAGGGLRWLLTYADMITLLLALFIFLYSVSEVSESRMVSFLQQWREAFTIIGKEPVHSRPNPIPEINQLKKIEEAFYERLSQELKRGEVKIETREEALVLQILNESLFFDPASARLRAESLPVLNKISELLRGLTNDVRVEGHTDPEPVSSPIYPSNWELSSARAASVARYMEFKGVDPFRMAVSGRAHYDPLQDLTPDDPRNRRVEIWILRKKKSG